MNYVYEFHWKSGAKDWAHGPDMKTVKEWYISHTECGDLDDCAVTRIKKSEWGVYEITNPDRDDPYPIETFADWMKREGFGGCDMIATTEF
jgi:hypothetical protein